MHESPSKETPKKAKKKVKKKAVVTKEGPASNLRSKI